MLALPAPTSCYLYTRVNISITHELWQQMIIAAMIIMNAILSLYMEQYFSNCYIDYRFWQASK